MVTCLWDYALLYFVVHVPQTCNKMKTKVVYDVSLGYRPKFERFRHELRGKCGEVQGEATPNITALFEVFVGGELVHSKKNGDRFVDSSAKLQKILDACAAHS